MLKDKKIVIGITASIAAFKIPFLIRLLTKEGAEVRVIMTPAAKDFVTPLTLSALSRNPVLTEPFDAQTGEWNSHVELGIWADAMIFAPVTANSLGKMAHGIADNFLLTTFLSARCPVFIVPAMDLDMFNHPTTKNNLEILSSFGVRIIEPQTGELASGLSGKGRMEEPEQICAIIRDFFDVQHDLTGKKVMVTAGPTYEKVDPVRFFGNHSTGLMGFSLAIEAAERGAEVMLITGPTNLACHHPSIKRIDVTSAAEMLTACSECFVTADITIMAAAVADYTYPTPSDHKLKKSDKGLSIDLVPTTDILQELGKKKRNNQVLVGFALETGDEVNNAMTKLKNKKLDFIVLNSLKDEGAGFGGSTNKVTIIHKSGKATEEPLKGKKAVARDIFNVILSYCKS
jgi:phosphopantothenoylcysteine decarboxylase / phosphopantothenate---cysteine ligase